MPKFEIEITDQQEKVVNAHIKDIGAWLQHAIENKARKCTDRIILVVTAQNPDTFTASEKSDIIDRVEVEPYSDERQFKELPDRLTYR